MLAVASIVLRAPQGLLVRLQVVLIVQFALLASTLQMQDLLSVNCWARPLSNLQLCPLRNLHRSPLSCPLPILQECPLVSPLFSPRLPPLHSQARPLPNLQLCPLRNLHRSLLPRPLSTPHLTRMCASKPSKAARNSTSTAKASTISTART